MDVAVVRALPLLLDDGLSAAEVHERLSGDAAGDVRHGVGEAMDENNAETDPLQRRLDENAGWRGHLTAQEAATAATLQRMKEELASVQRDVEEIDAFGYRLDVAVARKRRLLAAFEVDGAASRVDHFRRVRQGQSLSLPDRLFYAFTNTRIFATLGMNSFPVLLILVFVVVYLFSYALQLFR